MLGQTTCLNYAQVLQLRVMSHLVLDINTRDLVSSTRLELEPQLADTWWQVLNDKYTILKFKPVLLLFGQTNQTWLTINPLICPIVQLHEFLIVFVDLSATIPSFQGALQIFERVLFSHLKTDIKTEFG